MRGQRLAIAIIAMSVTIGALAGCALVPGSRSSPNPELQAALNAAVIPPGADRMDILVLGEPDEEPACDALDDESRTWILHGSTSEDVLAYLQSHPSPGYQVTSTGTFTDHGKSTGTDLTQTPVSADDNGITLVFSMVPLGSNDVEIRVDAQSIPDGADCIGAGSTGN